MYTNYVLFMNKPFWESLSADQQSLINEVTVEAIAKQRKLAAELNSNVITQLEEKGMAVNEVPQAVRDQMKTRMNAAIYDSLRERTGEQLFDQVISAVEAL